MTGMIIRRARNEDIPRILVMITEVFAGEQEIPEELIPIPEEMEPRWWCAEESGEIIGTIALYKDGEEWHMGRFAVSPDRRGNHLGSRLFQYAVDDVFSSGIPEIHCEARDVTVHIVESLGGVATGAAFPFFKGNVTPMILKKDSFQKKLTAGAAWQKE